MITNDNSKMEKFFSQNGQDKFLEKNIFTKINNGRFVDIGANDGITFSNTYFFEKKGWNGICVEPIPGVFEKLKNNRNCKCICGVISDKDIEFSSFLHVTGGSEMLSGILDKYDNEHLERIDKEIKINNEKKEILEVKNFNFNNLVKNKGIDYLSIDTEGSEFDILKAIDFSKFEIKIISIENDYNNKDIYNFLQGCGFSYLITIGSDEIYINNKHKNLIQNKFALETKAIFLKLQKNIKRIVKKIIKKCLKFCFL